MIIRHGKVAFPGIDEPILVDIAIERGKITAIDDCIRDDSKIIDASGMLILPGAIDAHVHFNEPGYTYREDFYHGTSAAASGGVTTVVDMPCTSIPPVTNLQNLHRKLSVIENAAVVDFGLYGGVSAQSFKKNFPENMQELSEYVLGYKTYFISGMESFGRLHPQQFKRVLDIAKIIGLPILLHAEDYGTVIDATKAAMRSGDAPMDYYRSRPESAETIAVREAVEIAEKVAGNLHIVHVATADAAEIVSESRVTCETLTHYLEFDTDDFNRIGSPLKVAPCVKSPGNKERLWKMLSDGKIDFIASDHASCPENEKNTGSIWTDYAGIPGTGTLLPYIFSEGYMKNRISLKRLVQITSEAAAKRYGIFERKGSIQIGKDADLAIIDPNATWTVEGKNFLSKGKTTPFEGMTFAGRIVQTILRGEVIYDFQHGIAAKAGYGKMLRRDMGKHEMDY